MSRSYKHYPFVKDRDSCKWGKRYCNKIVRKTKDIPNGKAYRKLVEPWDYIYDYSCSETWNEYKDRYSRNNRLWEGDKQEYYYWRRTYIMK